MRTVFGLSPFSAQNDWANHVDERSDVLAALAERRQTDRHDVQAEEEVLAEPAQRDLVLEVACWSPR